MTPDLRAALDQVAPEEIPEIIAALATRLAARLSGRLATTGADGHGDENLSVRDAARRLGMSRDWLYRKAEQLPFTIRIGRRLLFSAQGLEKWNRQRQGR